MRLTINNKECKLNKKNKLTLRCYHIAGMETKVKEEKKFTVYQLCFMALMAAVTCILAPMSIPIGPIPISLTNLVVYFTVYVIGTKAGVCSYCLYVLLGVVGLPVFSGYVGGPAKIAGPTGGYIIGFVLMGIIGGLFLEKFKRKFVFTAIGWILGTFVDYCLGTVWFVYVAHCSFSYALKVCVYPFIAFDLVKIVIATLLGQAVRYALIKAGLLENAKADAKIA